MATVRCSIPTALLEKPFFFFDKNQQNTISQLKTHKILQNLSPANWLSVGVFKDGETSAHPTGNAWYTWRGIGSGVVHVFTIKQILRKCTSSATRTKLLGNVTRYGRFNLNYQERFSIFKQAKKIDGLKYNTTIQKWWWKILHHTNRQTDKLTSCNTVFNT